MSPCWFQVGPCRPWGPGGLPRSGSGLEARFARRWAGAPLRVWILLGDQILLGGHCGKDCAPWGSSVLRGVSGGPEAPPIGSGRFPSSQGETLGAIGALQAHPVQKGVSRGEIPGHLPFYRLSAVSTVIK